MVHKLRSRALCPVRVARRVALGLVAWLGLAAWLPAEPPPVHFNHAGVMPPGAIGSAQLERGGPLPGYFQPVEIRVPEGAAISTAEVGQFGEPHLGPLTAGMLIGSVYRLRVTNIPFQQGLEVYPTIEVVDRLYPPLGMEFKFPIPIELTQEELEMALDGKMVVRVIYLEEPNTAVPAAQEPGDQPYFEAGDGDNPLEVADSLGRPMAILRMGARVPDAGGPDAAFMYGSPPLLKWRPYAATSAEACEPIVRTAPPPRLPVQQAAAVGAPIGRGDGRR
jgi:hypothetical protein